MPSKSKPPKERVKQKDFATCTTRLVLLLLPICQVAGAASHAADVAALLPLKALMLRSNSSWTGWQAARDPCGSASCGQPAGSSCAWQGVSCSDWRVVGLQLQCDASEGCSTPLKGPLPGSLTQLTQLTNLSLAGNLLTGSLPVWPVGSLLLALDLRGNKLTGPLPDGYALSLTHLQTLDLSSNTLTGNLPWEWSRMNELVLLDLSDNNLQGPVPLSWARRDVLADRVSSESMRSLQKLDLSSNCGLCGGVPMISGCKIRTVDTSLGDSCNMNGVGRCITYSYSNLMIALSILMGSLALCLLQRHICWRWRVASVLQRMQGGGLGGVDLETGPTGSAHFLKPIPSFTATVELSPSHHHIQAPAAALDCPRRPATAPPALAAVSGDSESSEQGGEAAAGAAAAAGGLASDIEAASPLGRLRAMLQQRHSQQGQAGGRGSERPGASAVPGVLRPPAVIVMPDGQGVALAVLEAPSTSELVEGKERPAAGDAAAANSHGVGGRRAEHGPQQARQRGSGVRQLLVQMLMFLLIQPIRPEDITTQPHLPRR